MKGSRGSKVNDEGKNTLPVEDDVACSLVAEFQFVGQLSAGGATENKKGLLRLLEVGVVVPDEGGSGVYQVGLQYLYR